MIREVEYCRLTDASSGTVWEASKQGNEAVFVKQGKTTEGKKQDIRYIQSLDIFFDLCHTEEWETLEKGSENADKLFIKRDGSEYSISSDVGQEFVKPMFEDLKRYFTCCFEGTARPYEMHLDSFDGGGPEYEFTTEKKGIFTWYCRRQYYKADHEELCGAGFDVIYSLFPLRKGTASAILKADSPICPEPPRRIYVNVSDKLEVSISQARADLDGAWEEPGVIGTRIEIEGSRITVLWRNKPVLETTFTTENAAGSEYDILLSDNKLRYSPSEKPYAEITSLRRTGSGIEKVTEFPISGTDIQLLERTENSRYGNYEIRDDLLGELQGLWVSGSGSEEIRIDGNMLTAGFRPAEITVLKSRSGGCGPYRIVPKDPSVYEFSEYFSIEYYGGKLTARPAILDAPAVTLVFTKKGEEK